MQNTMRQKRSLRCALFRASVGFSSLRQKVLDLTHQLGGGGNVVLLVKDLQAALGDLGGGDDTALGRTYRSVRLVYQEKLTLWSVYSTSFTITVFCLAMVKPPI